MAGVETLAPRVQVARRRFTGDDLVRMVQAGIVSEDDRVELVEGVIVEMSPVGARHAACVRRATRQVSRAVGNSAVVAVQDPIRLGEYNEPQPDLAILRPREDDYASGLPGPTDVLLVIEVSDTTLAYDRDVKLPLYAAAGIPEAWIMDINGYAIRRYTDPRDGEYRFTAVARRGGELPSHSVPGLILRAGDVLPSPKP